MNYFSKRNIVISVIAVLLIINIASISTIIYHTYDQPKVEETKEENSSMRVFRKELNLDQKQIEDFRVLGRAYRDKTKTVLVEMHEVRTALFNEMSSANPDTAKMFAMADEIGVLHAKIKHQTIEHFLEVRGKSTPEQFDRFVKLFQRALMDGDFGRGSDHKGRQGRPRSGRQQRNKN